MTQRKTPQLSLVDTDAVIFDLDGVITNTASAHFSAWKQTFDELLKAQSGDEFEPFSRQDYLTYVDGKPRYEGVKSFLTFRDIDLPEGDADSEPGLQTVRGIGDRKNERYQQFLNKGTIETFGDAVLFVEHLRERGIKTAMASSSKNGRTVLEQADLQDLFDAVVDGTDLAEQQLSGKPDPDMFVEAARRLGVEPGRAVVVEDAQSGVQAGRAGGFRHVVGVARHGDIDTLAQAGADVVIENFEQLHTVYGGNKMARKLNSAMNSVEEIVNKIGNNKPAIFLDYDGTLTPIIDEPDQAVLSPEMREAVEDIARACPVAVVSGRDLGDVRERVGVDGIAYAGSHGFDILGPDEETMTLEKGEDFLPALDQAEEELRRRVGGIDGALIERKRYSLAVHYRQVADEDVNNVEEQVDQVLDDVSRLKKTHGKKVFDLQPDIDWDKGKAVNWLLDKLGLSGSNVVPMYIGDDVTDEDAFRALSGRGVTIAVQEVADDTAAEYRLDDPLEVKRFLKALAQRIRAEG